MQSNGIATAPTFMANGYLGTYTVSAAVSGAASVAFTLTNTAVSVTGSPSLVLNNNTPEVFQGAGTGSVIVTNMLPTISIQGGFTVDTSGTHLSVLNNGCSGTLAASSSCTITFTSSNVTADASSSAKISISNQATNTLRIPIAALNAIVMSPPLTDNSVQMLLVAGCTNDQIIEIVNNSNTAIDGNNIDAAISIPGAAIDQNYCKNVTLSPVAAYGTGGVCMIEVATGSATTGSGILTITDSGSGQQIAISTKVISVDTGLASSITPGTTIIQNDRVFYLDKNTGPTTSCNTVKVSDNSTLPVAYNPWSVSHLTTSVPYPGTTTSGGAQNIYQGQPNTISVMAGDFANGDPYVPNTEDASAACIYYNEHVGNTYSTNWYSPSICELNGNNNYGGQGGDPGCTNSDNNMATELQLSFAYSYWSSTEAASDPTLAWYEVPAQSAAFVYFSSTYDKGAQLSVICARAFTAS